MDVKGDILAVAVQEPVGGALFFDVSDPAHPKFLSRYVHAACALGDNCGAYVEMMSDGKSALLALQQTDLMPGLVSGYAGQGPGVAVIDLADPKNPRLSQEYHTVSVQGIHTARSFVIADGPAAGEYAFLIQNGVGTEITRVVDTPGRQAARAPLRRAGGATRPTSPRRTTRSSRTTRLDGRTYLYNAGGFPRLQRLRHHRPGDAEAGRRVGPRRRECERLVRAHDRRHAPQGPPLRDDAGRAVRLRLDRTRAAWPRCPTMTRPTAAALRRQRRQGRARCGSSTRPTSRSSARRTTRSRRASRCDGRGAEAGSRTRSSRRGRTRPARRRVADVLAAQPADRRRPHLPLALPRRRLRARRVGGVRRHATSARAR